MFSCPLQTGLGPAAAANASAYCRASASWWIARSAARWVRLAASQSPSDGALGPPQLPQATRSPLVPKACPPSWVALGDAPVPEAPLPFRLPDNAPAQLGNTTVTFAGA